ncbi:MAG: glycosyltransferase family 2 protein [Candidatus Pacebacteria bacterium]|nr:glycosyltransferase family 2 protein [Candidatus Paceibacterota bacterium]
MNSNIKYHLAVIILNYYGLHDTLECLHSIFQSKTANFTYDVVIVNEEDDDRKENQSNEIKKAYPNVHSIESKNLGFSGANNLGAKYAFESLHADGVIFLNNDTRVEENSIQNIGKWSIQHQNEICVASPKIYFEKGYEFHKETYKKDEIGRVIWYAGGNIDKKNVFGWHRNVDEIDRGQCDDEEETDFATGCCMVVSKKTWEVVGSWNTSYFMYLEDLEYCERVRRKKGSVWYVPSAVIWHKNAGSTGGSGSRMHAYYQTRNRFMYGLRYASFRTKLALLRELFSLLGSRDVTLRSSAFDVLIHRYGKRQEFHAKRGR